MKDLTADNDAIELLGVRYKTILSSAQTGGAMAIVDSLSPVGSGPPRHVHENEDETFVMMTGSCKLWIDGAERVAGPGESVFIPRGTEHTFKVVGDVPCRHLVILTPGGFEGFFADMAAGQFRIPDDMPAIEASARRHSLRFTGPPLECPGISALTSKTSSDLRQAPIADTGDRHSPHTRSRIPQRFEVRFRKVRHPLSLSQRKTAFHSACRNGDCVGRPGSGSKRSPS